MHEEQIEVYYSVEPNEFVFKSKDMRHLSGIMQKYVLTEPYVKSKSSTIVLSSESICAACKETIATVSGQRISNGWT